MAGGKLAADACMRRGELVNDDSWFGGDGLAILGDHIASIIWTWAVGAPEGCATVESGAASLPNGGASRAQVE